jgi:stage IV sporulation protein FB
MLKFSLLGVPVAIEGWFWLSTILLGGGATAHNPEAWTLVGVWTGVVLVSILVHELGHAAAGRRFGAAPFIRLHGFGGATFLPGARFSRGQSILVSAAGPAAGLLLGLVVFLVARAFPDLPYLAERAVADGLYVNFFWTLVNLLPIQPLDGGQILGQVLGPARNRITSLIGAAVAAALCIWTIHIGLLFSAFMLALLAYYNFRRVPVEGGVITS